VPIVPRRGQGFLKAGLRKFEEAPRDP